MRSRGCSALAPSLCVSARPPISFSYSDHDATGTFHFDAFDILYLQFILNGAAPLVVPGPPLSSLPLPNNVPSSTVPRLQSKQHKPRTLLVGGFTPISHFLPY